MKTALQVTSWIMVGLALLAASAAEDDPDVLIGAVLIFSQAALALMYVKRNGEKSNA